MALSFRKLTPCFAVEVSPVDLRKVHAAATLAEIRAGMDEDAVLVFHDQPFTDQEHLAFARRLDGEPDNRLWHTDTSFQDPPGRYAMLSARIVPPAGADTEFADMRAAYEARAPELKARLERLQVHHSIAHSREMLGFEFSAEEADALKGAVHPNRATHFEDARHRRELHRVTTLDI
jgi:alpha-ketoglutarate-dependent 2,4-dichlorophenoxyacetate dioxygenase